MKQPIRLSITVCSSLLAILMTACSAGPSSDSLGSQGNVVDDSASGAAASAVGGALSNSESNGSQAFMNFKGQDSFVAYLKNAMNPMPRAFADTFCPTFKTNGVGCTTSGSSMWLAYDDCTFSGRATWNGVQEITMSTGTASCGSFPNPGDNGTLFRQMVQSAGSSLPGTVTLDAGGLTAVVDDETANLANFDGDSIATVENGGYGAAVSFNGSGARDSVTVSDRVYVTGWFDHSITGTVAVSEAAHATTRTITGSVTVYHNLLKVIGTSTFNDVIHEDICCLPVGGSITTVFSAGANVSPTTDGQLMVGKSETLTFTGCGSATLQKYDGTTSNVTLDRCF